MMKNNIFFRIIFVTVFSLIVTLTFAGYNAFLGIWHGDAFAIGIAIYDFILVWIKSATLWVERKITLKDPITQSQVRIKNYQIASMLIFLLDLCLIAPVILLVINPKDVNFGMIPSIAMATYVVYQIVVAIINYRKSKKSRNPTVILLREINLIEAIVAVLTLQHVLIMVNGGMNQDMQTLSLVTSVGFIILIILFSIFSFLHNWKLFQMETNEDEKITNTNS